MRSAKARGFGVELIYVCLDSAEQSILRVQDRVAKGGHDVPDRDVRRRYERSLSNLSEALRITDKAVAYDNSGAEPRKVLEARRGVITWRGLDEPGWITRVCRKIVERHPEGRD